MLKLPNCAAPGAVVVREATAGEALQCRKGHFHSGGCQAVHYKKITITKHTKAEAPLCYVMNVFLFESCDLVYHDLIYYNVIYYHWCTMIWSIMFWSTVL